jgi:molecular chaperone GrpE
MTTPASSPGSREQESGEPEAADAVDGGAVATDAAATDDGEVIEPEEAPEVVLLDPLAEAERRLEESESRLRMVSKAYTDLQQDMAAFRKRVEEQGKLKSNLKAFEAVKTFFEPCQNLRRSVQDCGDEVGALGEGLRLIVQQFDAGLDSLGLAELPGEGSVFNPEYHEALALSPVPDKELDGRVIMVHTVGYAVNGKVLQAAQVIVGQYTEEEPPEA